MSAASDRTFVIASRSSKLAQVQTNLIIASFNALYPSESTEPRPKFTSSFMSTELGDRNKSDPLYLLGAKALWTKDLESALLKGEVDMLVHSLKDVPTTLPEGCMIGAVSERSDPVDALVIKAGKEDVWKTLDDLPVGSVVGTSSVRRVAQLQRNYPQLKFSDIRGNIDTRLAKLDAPDGPYSAIIIAKAGLVRMGWGHRVTLDLTPPIMYHAVSQGALGVEIRNNDTEALELCKKITHWQTHYMCFAERACLRLLEGGCSVPVGMSSSIEGDVLVLTGCVTALDGSQHVDNTVRGTVASLTDAEELGKELAHSLIEKGARSILDEIFKEREQRMIKTEA